MYTHEHTQTQTTRVASRPSIAYTHTAIRRYTLSYSCRQRYTLCNLYNPPLTQTNTQRGPTKYPGAAAPLSKVTAGVIVTVRVRLRAAGVCNPRLGPRSGNFAGLKESRGQFHEKIGASFYKQPQPPESSYFVSDVFFSLVCMARGGDTTAQMES